MKTSAQKVLTTIFIVALFIACSKKSEVNSTENESIALPDSIASGRYHTSPATEIRTDSARKFIRTAELTFKVKNTAKATYVIENIVERMGGFVTYTNLLSDATYKTTVPTSADSSTETTRYTVNNTITIRIPNTRLDTTLRAINQLIDYLDSRTIKADDVSLQLYANSLTQSRVRAYEKTWVKVLEKRKPKDETAELIGENLMYRWEQADQATVENLSLKDKVNFSTINLSIYQNPTIKQELIAREKEIKTYEPPFGTKLAESLAYGWYIVEHIILFLTRLWGFFVAGAAIFVAYRKFGNPLQK